MKNLILQDSISFPDINLDGVKGVLIDLDDTLYFYKQAHEKAFRSMYDKVITSLCKISFQQFVKQIEDIWQDFYKDFGATVFTHNRMVTFQRFAEKNNIKKPYIVAERMQRIYFDSFMKTLKTQGPALQAKEFLKKCKEQKIPVCLVTDMYAIIQVRKLKSLGLTNYVDLMVSNDEVGSDKPNPKMFKRALQKLNLKPKDVIMVGNDLERDIEGARKLGISTYQVVVHK
ncbi:MAG: HAD family hydrolase [Alphaproteobacteria bacterium]|nr:HAD family hydrolase [Alphaproteobacteria bacterium]